MEYNKIINYCLNKNKAYLDYPFGDIPICVKLNNKIFAQIYPLENDYKITLKCDELLAELYRKQYKDVVVKGYHCPSVQARFFNTIYIDKIPEYILLEMIDHSYEQVLKSFSRKVQTELMKSE